MLATTNVLLHHIEAQRIREQYQTLLPGLIEVIATSSPQYNQQTFHRRLPRQFLKSPLARSPVLKIFRDGQLWFQYQPRQTELVADYEFTVTSHTGENFLIKTVAPRPPRFLAEWVQRKHKLELLVILFVSAIVSLLLSWSMARPLQQLGRSSRLFARGERPTPIQNKLLNRGDEIGELARDMAYMMNTVTSTLQSQKQLLHDVSHELRAPLARLQVAAELIQQKDEQNHPYIERIHAECSRIDQLIQRILNFSRMEENASLSEFDVTALLQEQIANTQFEAAERLIHFNTAHSHAMLRGYRELLQQCIENVLRNACKYTSSTTVIDVTLSANKNECVITIRDHGDGVSEHEIKRLTETFYRADNTEHNQGFGLGLSIAQRAMDKHGGTLQLQNHPQGGLQVILTIPR